MLKQKIGILIKGALLIFACTSSSKKITKPVSSLDLLNIISSDPLFWFQIGFAKDPTQLDSIENPLFYDDEFNQAIKESKFIRKAIRSNY